MKNYQKKTVLFIDGANVYAACRALGVEIDYRALLLYYEKACDLRRAFFYSAILETEEYSPLRPLTDWLSYNGYTVVSKPAREYHDESGRRRVAGNMDVEIAVDMVEMAPSVDNMVLFSGDSDFRFAVEVVQRRGVRVTVVSTIKTNPAMIGDELRRQADQFVDLADIVHHFTRTDTRARSAWQSQDERVRFFEPN